MKKILLLLLIPIIVFSYESAKNVNEINIDEHLENLDRFFPDKTYKGLFCDDRGYKSEYNLLTVSIETNNVYHFLKYKLFKSAISDPGPGEELWAKYTSSHWIDIDNNKIDYDEKRVRENIIYVRKFYGDTALIIDRTSLKWRYDTGLSSPNYHKCVILSKEEMQRKATELASLIKQNQKEIYFWKQRELARRKL